jgi:hypothetical protein
MWQDVMVLGDLNAACRFIRKKDWQFVSLKTRPEFTWWIGDDIDTTVKGTRCAYDRLYPIYLKQT